MTKVQQKKKAAAPEAMVWFPPGQAKFPLGKSQRFRSVVFESWMEEIFRCQAEYLVRQKGDIEQRVIAVTDQCIALFWL